MKVRNRYQQGRTRYTYPAVEFTPNPTPSSSDGFNRPDGLVEGGWTDWSDTLEFPQQAVIVDGRVGQGDMEAVDGYVVLTKDTPLTQTGEFEMVMDHHHPLLFDIFNQVGPVVNADHEAVDELAMGVTAAFDISVASFPFYFYNVLNGSPHGVDVEDYEQFDMTWWPTSDGTPGTNTTWILRVSGGEMAMYVNFRGGPERRVCGPVPLPYPGQTGAGGQVMYGPWPTPDEPAGFYTKPYYPIDGLVIRPLTAVVGPYSPTPNIDATSNGVKAAASASINVPYPATPTAGSQFWCAIMNQNAGSVAAPVGWTLAGQHVVSSTRRLHLFTRDALAVGDETGTVTFTKGSGTGNLGGAMWTVEGFNPYIVGATALNRVSFVGSSGAASTDIVHPGTTVLGPNRLMFWCGAVLANQAITVPATWTEVANLGTGDSTAINLAVACKEFSESPTAPTGAVTGTVAASVASTSIMWLVSPDPDEV